MLDWDSLYGEAGERAVTGGKKRFYDNRVSNLQSETTGGKFSVTATVCGDRDYATRITFDEQGGLYDYACDCAADKTLDGPCRHIVAAALAYETRFPSLEERVKTTDSFRRSDAGTLSLIDYYGKTRRRRKIAESGEKVRLVPFVAPCEDGRLKIKFSIGAKKMYSVKDVADFVSCCNSGAEKRYGVELTVLHVPESFDEQSAKLVSFVCGSWREKTEFLNDLKTVNPDYKDELRLSAGGVDEFIKLYSGQLVNCSFGGITGALALVTAGVDSMCARFKLSRVNGGFILEDSLGEYIVVNGKEYKYVIADGRIYTLSNEFFGAVMPLVRAIERRGRLFIAQTDMTRFYNTVLSGVMLFTEISAEGIDLSVFEAAPLEIRMYLDARNGGGIKATVHASYDGENDVDIFDDGISSPFVRDYESELAFLRLLEKYFPDCPYLEVDAEADVYYLLREGLREFMGCAEVFMSDAIKKMGVKKPPRIKVGVRLRSDLLGVSLSAEEYTPSQLREILAAYRDKRAYVRLTDGSFVDLVDSSIAAIGEVADAAAADGDELTLPLWYAPYVDGELKSGFFHLERSDDFKQLVKELGGAEESITEVPPSLKSVLRNYQKAGYRWLKTLSRVGFGGILADDMGLGKTLQIIALLLSERSGVSIVVCPTTLVLNWIRELEKFAPELKTLAVTGSGDERKLLAEKTKDYDVVVTSYELLRRDDELYKDVEFDFAVIDEAQYIKNPDTKNARAVKKLKARHRFALTGTPVENSLAELWSIFDFIMPGYLFSYVKFRDGIESEIARGNDGAQARLERLIKPFILRRLKSGVLKELPPKMETDVVCPLEGEQRKVYAANLSLVRESVAAAGDKVNKVAVLSMLTKLRQICCEPRLVYSDYCGNSAKLNACMELVQSAAASGHKVLIFSQFTSMLDVLRARLTEEGITFFLLKGDTPKVERLKIVSRFNSDSTRVFLISLKAGGTGLNLTGADVVIHYDPWWNDSVMTQATDRAYRIGQNKSVQVYKLIMQDSIEENIMKLQQKKNAISGIVMNAASAGSLGADEILKLLGK